MKELQIDESPRSLSPLTKLLKAKKHQSNSLSLAERRRQTRVGKHLSIGRLDSFKKSTSYSVGGYTNSFKEFFL
jgi:hypothetical protein